MKKIANPIPLRIEPHAVEALKAIAKREGRTFAGQVRVALEEWLMSKMSQIIKEAK